MGYTDINPSQQFRQAAPVGLPGGVRVTGYAVQPYHWIGEAGSVQVSELLVRMVGPDGKPVNNEKYFTDVHTKGLGFEVDYELNLKAIDWAIDNDHLEAGKPEKVIALNLFPDSISRELFEDMQIILEREGLEPSNVLLEILEKESPIGAEQLNAIKFARKLGFMFGADDVEPRSAYDRDRVRMIGEYCTVIKLRREVIRDYRNGTYEELPPDLEALMQGQEFYLLAEGVPRSHQHSISHLPIRATQSKLDTLSPDQP